MRSWLNGYESSANLENIDYSNDNFIDTAFTSEEQSKIKTTNIANKENSSETTSEGTSETTGGSTEKTLIEGTATDDKIYILSEDEAYTTEYGFSNNSNKENAARQAKSSTYAKAMGTKSNDSGNCYWWLRTPGSHWGLTVLVRDSGSVYTGGQHASSKSRGVRPAMHINIECESHSMEHVTAKDATCTETGNQEYWYCRNCMKYFKDSEGKTETTVEAETIAKKAHSMTKHEGQDADCTKAGRKTYWTCSSECCNGIYYLKEDGTESTESADDLVIAKKAHSLTKTEAEEATCCAAGNNEYWICSECQGVFKDEAGTQATTVEAETIAKKAHSMTKHEGQDADCTKAGRKTYWTCSSECCNGIYYLKEDGTESTNDAEALVIQKLNHNYKAEWNGDETYHWHECTCGDKTDYEKHIWNNGDITTPATETTDGVKTYTCTTCSATKTEKIDKTGSGTSESSGDGSNQDQKSEAVSNAETVIGSINVNDISLDSEEQIIAARETYENLSAEEKQDVENYSKLEAAEKALQEYRDKYVPAKAEPKAQASGSGTVKLSWPAVDKAEGYDIYRKAPVQVQAAVNTGMQLTGDGYELIGTVETEESTVPEYTDKGLENGIEYKYIIVAVNHDNKDKKIEIASAEITVTPCIGQVTNLKLAKGRKSATVRWSAVTGATGYKVYRSTKKTSGFKCVKTIKGKTVRFVNKKLKSKKTYYFKVRAYATAAGKTSYGAYSVVKSVKTK